MNTIADKFSPWERQNIALAAVAQCAALVHQIASLGEAPEFELVASINPLLIVNPDSIDDIYPNLSDLSLGLRSLQDIFSNDRAKENSEIVRYTLGMILLRNKLTGNRTMQSAVRQRLSGIERLVVIEPGLDLDPDLNPELHSDLNNTKLNQNHTFEQLARLYQDTISTLPYRIQVQGKIENLKNENIANRIRALLLGGIRSAVLWYQLGGRRWHLVFYRKRVQETAGNIRRKLLTSV